MELLHFTHQQCDELLYLRPKHTNRATRATTKMITAIKLLPKFSPMVSHVCPMCIVAYII